MAEANLQNELAKELQDIDDAIADQNAKIKRGEALERLVKNKDFQSVIMEGYLAAEAGRLFEILTTPPGNRKDVLDTTHDKLSAVRHFKEYVGTESYPGIVRREAENAPDVIEEQEIYRKEVTSGNSVEG